MDCNIITHILFQKFNILMTTFVETCRGVGNKVCYRRYIDYGLINMLLN